MGIAHCTSCYLLPVNIRSVVANSPMKLSRNWLVLHHDDDLLMHNSTVAIICPSKHLHLCNKRIHWPIFGIRVLYPINGFPSKALPFTLKFLISRNCGLLRPAICMSRSTLTVEANTVITKRMCGE